MRHLTNSLLLCLALSAASADLTFLHLSDVHYPHAKHESADTIAALPCGPMAPTPYHVTSDAPAFAVVTGDLNEFGGGNGAWEGYLDLWKGLGVPVYHQLGNHDNTWDCARPRLRKLHGSPFYSFDHSGVRFIGFDTSTAQDPRPSIPTEGLLWLQRVLAETPPQQPVVFFCHHALNNNEFASEYARLRLIELLQTRNVVLVLDGHGHGTSARNLAGFDCVMGGSTYGATRGYGIVSIQGDMLRVCHQFIGGEMRPLLEKRLPAKSPFIQMGAIAPGEAQVFRAGPPVFRVGADVPDAQGRWTCGDRQGDLIRSKAGYRAELPPDLAPGAHAVKFEFTGANGLTTLRTRRFWIDGGPLRIRWVRALAGSCQSSPVIAGKRLHIGTNDGALQALDVGSGRTQWRHGTNGEVRATPVILPNGDICAASSDGSVFARAPSGRLRWQTDTGAPVYASPIVVGDRVICAGNTGEIVALSARDGEIIWRCAEPTYTIESGFAASADTVFTGSWDGHVYGVNVADGSVRWKSKSAGSSRKAAPLYYSPADCAPVYAAGKVFVADRAMLLNIFDAATGQLLASEGNCSAVGPGSEDTVLVRHTDGRVTRRRVGASVPDARTVWEAKVPTGFVPTPPVEAVGKVYMVSSAGLLSVLDGATGAVIAQVQAAPGLFMFSAPAVAGDTVYVADEAGDVVALQLVQ